MPDLSKSTDESGGPPSPRVRSVLSVLLFLHLFAICISLIVGNFGRLRSFSALMVGTENVLSPYTSTLLLNSPHDDSLISEMPYDSDHRFDVELTFADGHKEQMRLGAGAALPERRQRYVQMANLVAQLADDQISNADALANVLCKGLLNSTGATGVTLNCRRYRPQTIPDVRSSDPIFQNPRDPHFLIAEEDFTWGAEQPDKTDDASYNIWHVEKSKSDVASPKTDGSASSAPPVKPRLKTRDSQPASSLPLFDDRNP